MLRFTHRILRIILSMEEILHHLGCIKPCKNNGNNYHINWWVYRIFFLHQQSHPHNVNKGSFGNPSSMPRHLRKLQLWESHSSFARVLQEIFPKASTIQPSADLQILSFPCWKRYSEITYPNWILSNLHWKYCMRLKLFVKSMFVIGF